MPKESSSGFMTLSSENSVKSHRTMNSSRTTTAAFADQLDRFTEYGDIRHRKLLREEARFDHLGPGSYFHNILENNNGRFNRVPSPTFSHCSDSKFTDKTFISDAPPVGTYNIPRILSPVPNNSMKQTLTSSFKNSGREKSLLTNGKYYQTLNEDKTMSNVGPGMYDLSPYPSYMGRQLINPTINDYRYRQHREADYKNEHNTVHFIDRTKRLSMNDIIGKNSSLSSTTVQRPHTTSSLTQNQQTTSPNRVSIKEKQVISERNNDIQSVRALPQYPYRGK